MIIIIIIIIIISSSIIKGTGTSLSPAGFSGDDSQ